MLRLSDLSVGSFIFDENDIMTHTNTIARKLSYITHTFSFFYFRHHVEVKICFMIIISLSTFFDDHGNKFDTHTHVHVFFSNNWEKQQIAILLASVRLLSEKCSAY